MLTVDPVTKGLTRVDSKEALIVTCTAFIKYIPLKIQTKSCHLELILRQPK